MVFTLKIKQNKKEAITFCAMILILFSILTVFLLSRNPLFEFSGQKQQSVDQFLSRLPQSVIKDGKIIDVRSGVENVIKVCSLTDRN